MKTVRLYGELGKKFGKERKFNARTPAEVLRALMTVVPGFKNYLIDDKSGKVYTVYVGSDDMLVNDLQKPTSDKDIIRIVPIVHGSGDFFKIVLGIALVAVSFMLPGSQALLGKVLMNVGASLIIGGVSGLLFGGKTNDINDSYERPENKPSYAFDGPINTIKQGNPIPIGYGTLRVGSQVVSGGLRSVTV